MIAREVFLIQVNTFSKHSRGTEKHKSYLLQPTSSTEVIPRTLDLRSNNSSQLPGLQIGQFKNCLNPLRHNVT